MHIHPFTLDLVVAERRARLLRRAGQVGLPNRRGTGRGADEPSGIR